MHKLKYKIITLDPVVIAETKGENNFVMTSDFIPGNTVLGTLANQYIKAENLNNDIAHTNPDFYKFFLTENLVFTNAYIISEENGKELINYPVPLSIQHDKDNTNTVFDLFFQEPIDNSEKVQTKTLNEFGRIHETTLTYQPVKKSLNFHHERNSKTGSSKKGMIFNYESINRKQVFEGYILGESEDLKNLQPVLKRSFEAKIGRSKSVQYGKVKFDFIGEPEEIISEITDAKFDDSTEIVLTFLSDVILYNENGFSVADERLLEKCLQEFLSNETIKIAKRFSKENSVENYVNVWKNKKPSETTFKAGSCFLLTGITNTNYDKLKELQLRGIGERRNEGFGRVVFNYQRDEIRSIVNFDDVIKPFNQPAEPVPDLTKDKLTFIIRDILQKEAKYLAILAENSLSNKESLAKSKSLVSRLESFVKGSKNKSEFDNMLNQLRKTAIEKLEKCTIDNKKFYQWLLDKNDITTEIILNDSKYVEIKDGIIKKIPFDVKQEDFNNRLFKTYFVSFFAALRKSLKKIGA